MVSYKISPLCSFIKRHSGTGVFKNTFFIEHLWATASKYNVTFKELFNLIELLKRKHCLNILSSVN